MKQIMLNLKRFDVPRYLGGINELSPIREYGKTVVEKTQEKLEAFENEAHFIQYYPEAQIVSALNAKNPESKLEIGCQGLYWEDVVHGGNFGAFTSLRPASAMAALGCTSAIIGHCEERQAFERILKYAGSNPESSVDRILNQEVIRASDQGMSVLFCVGEKEEEHNHWEQVLKTQIETGLAGVDLSNVVIAYEPIWSIGPGKKPAGEEHIRKVVSYIKQLTKNSQVIYGGGLKKENAAQLGKISELDGGLIALTRFGKDFGFFPEEYLDIIDLYLNASNK